MSNLPKITDSTLYKHIRKALPIKVVADKPEDEWLAELAEFLMNHNNVLHHAALTLIRARKGQE